MLCLVKRGAEKCSSSEIEMKLSCSYLAEDDGDEFNNFIFLIIQVKFLASTNESIEKRKINWKSFCFFFIIFHHKQLFCTFPIRKESERFQSKMISDMAIIVNDYVNLGYGFVTRLRDWERRRSWCWYYLGWVWGVSVWNSSNETTNDRHSQ